jgi:hypothetical protein
MCKCFELVIHEINYCDFSLPQYILTDQLIKLDVMTIHVFVKGYPLIVEQSPLFLEIYPLFLEQLNSPYYDAMPRCRCHMEGVNYIPYYL